MPHVANSRLDSWKDIANYLGRDLTTAMRWEKEKGLPVHRVPGGKRHAVFAYSGEIDRWLDNSPVVEPQAPPAEREISAAGSLNYGVAAQALTVDLGLNNLNPVSSTPSSVARTVNTGTVPLPHPRSRLKLLAFSAACLVLVAMPVFLAKKGRWGAPPLRVTPRPAITSLAVLPLQNLSNDPTQEYFVDGMTDSLITELARVRSLSVISRTSVMPYKGTRKPLPQIARELDVDAVVEGTVLRSGDRMRITAQLVDGATDRHLWAEKYERSLGDVLALQSEVAEAIAREVRVSVDPHPGAAKGPRRIDPEAYELYAKGRFLWNRASPGDLQKAEKFFQQALEKEPDWALAYAGLADVYSVPYDPRAFEAAKKALELDESLAEAHNSLAMSLLLRWDFAGAEKDFRRAIELNPNYSTAHQMYAFLLSATGRHEEALAEVMRAQQLDPISLYVSESLGDILFFARRYDAAIARYHKTLEMDPHSPLAHHDLGDAYLQKRMYREAIAEFERADGHSVNESDLLASLGQAYGLAGERAKAEKVLVRLSEQSKRNPDSWYFAAPVYLGLGHRERALNCLEKAYTARAHALASLKMDPRLDGLRSEARFQDLMRRVGLPL